METTKLFKGPNLEEKLRQFFIKNGYFVVRGVKFVYDGFDITDVDLWLYNRPSFVARERTIVDIKNKKTPQAIERIFWVKGLMSALHVDKCIVATPDYREAVRTFGKKNDVLVLDGNFLKKLSEFDPIRLSEEDFVRSIRANDTLTSEYFKKYEAIKKSLLILDFATCNFLLNELQYFYRQILTNPQQRIEATRLLYYCISFILITLDFINKDLASLSDEERIAQLDEGFKYGNTGRKGIEKVLDLAISISKQPYSRKQEFLKVYEELPSDNLRDYFSKIENSSKLFRQAKLFEQLAFANAFVAPNSTETELKGLLFLFADFHKIDRRHFFEAFPGSATSNV